MRLNFHESFAQGAIEPPSERSTGLTLVAVTLLIAYLWRDNTAVLVSAVCAGGVLALLSAFAPALLRLPNLLWFRFSTLLQKVVNPIVIFTLFAAVVVRGGVFVLIFHDPLVSRRDL